MKIIEITDRDPLRIEPLVDVWESSVRVTHGFLSESEIERIKQYVPQALKEIPHLILAEDEGGHQVAFMGIEADKLEMQSEIDM